VWRYNHAQHAISTTMDATRKTVRKTVIYSNSSMLYTAGVIRVEKIPDTIISFIVNQPSLKMTAVSFNTTYIRQNNQPGKWIIWLILGLALVASIMIKKLFL